MLDKNNEIDITQPIHGLIGHTAHLVDSADSVQPGHAPHKMESNDFVIKTI